MWKKAQNPDLFGGLYNGPEEVIDFSIPGGELCLFPRLVGESESESLFAKLLEETRWVQESITLYGKTCLSPRLTAWHGDPGKSYKYSGIHHSPLPWTAGLTGIRQLVQQAAEVEFNSVLLNLYRSGIDSVSWHADDEPELGRNPVIASVSLGAARTFQLKHKTRRGEKRALVLQNGSCLVMKGSTQHNWLHQVPKEPSAAGQRINLTFRVIKK